MTTAAVRIGRYRHFKGGDYDVLGVAVHTETGAQLVVYVKAGEPHHLWVRPVGMFLETVDYDGQALPRFRPI